MKIYTREAMRKLNSSEKDFMLYLMGIQKKIDNIDETMKNNIACRYYQTIRNYEDVSEDDEDMKKLREYTITLCKMSAILDEILDNI